MVKNDVIKTIVESCKNDGKILVCGNGGLAAESEHFTAELVGKFAFDVYVPCIALTSNTSLLTALSNDMGFEEVFAHQIRAMGKKNDIFIAMTTSRSKNVVRAIETAKGMGLTTIAVCGFESGDLGANFTFAMSGRDTARMQENAIKFLHQLAYEIKKEMR